MSEDEWTTIDQIGMQAPVTASMVEEIRGRNLDLKEVVMTVLVGMGRLEADLRAQIDGLRTEVRTQSDN